MVGGRWVTKMAAMGAQGVQILLWQNTDKAKHYHALILLYFLHSFPQLHFLKSYSLSPVYGARDTFLHPWFMNKWLEKLEFIGSDTVGCISFVFYSPIAGMIVLNKQQHLSWTWA